VAREVEALRGWSFIAPVPTRVWTERQLGDYIASGLFEEEYHPGEVESIAAFLTLVGLLPPGADLRALAARVLETQVEGFYDPDTDTLTMIHRSPDTARNPLFRIMVAHELTHALDDQIVGLDSLIARRERTEDAEFVLGALIEGSATALMSRYAARHGRSDLGEFADVEGSRAEPFLDAPAYFLTLLARYTCGMYFLTRDDPTNIFDREGGLEVGENLRLAAVDLPESSEQILHPRRYWDPARRDPPVRAADEDVDTLAAGLGWRVTHRNTAGEILMAMLSRSPDAFDLLASGRSSEWTTEAARGWGGDRFYVLHGAAPDTTAVDIRADDAAKANPAPPDSAARGIWVTAWDTPEDRDEFVDAYAPRHPSGLSRRVDLGPRVTVYLYGMTPEEAARAETALRAKPPRLQKGGAAWGG
jgi:hypothetical protein